MTRYLMPRLCARTIRRRLNGQSRTNGHESAVLPSDEEFAEFLDLWSRSCMAGSSLRNAFVATFEMYPRFHQVFHDVIHLIRRGAPLTELGNDEIPAAWRATLQLADATHSPTVLARGARQFRRYVSSRREAITMLSTARSSLRVLSWSPLVLAAVVLVLSDSARSFMFGSRAGLLASAGGVLLHSMGRLWMSRLFVSPPENSDIALLDAVATALAAGFTVPQTIHHLPQWWENDIAERSATRLPFGVHEALEVLREISPDVASAVDLIERATRDGLPVAESLDKFAEELRVQRTEYYRAHIRTMSVKANIPLVVCILPSFILLTLTPLVAVIMAPLGSVG